MSSGRRLSLRQRGGAEQREKVEPSVDGRGEERGKVEPSESGWRRAMGKVEPWAEVEDERGVKVEPSIAGGDEPRGKVEPSVAGGNERRRKVEPWAKGGDERGRRLNLRRALALSRGRLRFGSSVARSCGRRGNLWRGCLGRVRGSGTLGCAVEGPPIGQAERLECRHRVSPSGKRARGEPVFETGCAPRLIPGCPRTPIRTVVVGTSCRRTRGAWACLARDR